MTFDFNETFRKNVTYDNTKSHQKSGLHPRSRKHNFEKTTGRGFKLTPPPLTLFRVEPKNTKTPKDNGSLEVERYFPSIFGD